MPRALDHMEEDACGRQAYIPRGTNINFTMDQISMKTPNPKSRLFLKIYR